MEWLKTILPLVGVLIGFLLSESGKLITDKRQDKRKLKKLLFYLLELRYHFAKELSNEKVLDKFINFTKVKMSEKFNLIKEDPEFVFGMNAFKPLLLDFITKTKIQDDKFQHLEENIDSILIELAEVFPILAYELIGQHNIKERLANANNYFSELETITNEIPFNINEWIKPKLTQELLKDLDISIERIAIKIDKNTLLESKRKISKMNFDEDDIKGIEPYINECLDKIEEII